MDVHTQQSIHMQTSMSGQWYNNNMYMYVVAYNFVWCLDSVSLSERLTFQQANQNTHY